MRLVSKFLVALLLSFMAAGMITFCAWVHSQLVVVTNLYWPFVWFGTGLICVTMFTVVMMERK